MKRHIQVAAATVALAVSTAGLAACSSGSSARTSTTASASAAASASGPSASGSGAPGQRNNLFASAKVQACLKAAGITVPTGGNFPRRSGSFPSGSRPSGSRPSGFPSGSRPSGAGGFGGNSAQSKQIQAALKACGITLPTGGFRRPSATPSASPTS